MTPVSQAGIRPRFRILATATSFFALFLGVLAPMASHFGERGWINPPLFLLVLAPWLLGVLIMIIERRSPLKFWAAPLLLSFIAPALAFVLDWAIVENWLRTQALPNLLVTLAINIALVGTFTIYATAMCPCRCPECRRWAMIPLRSLWGPSARTAATRWCSSCGAKYWKTLEGEWRKERRQTWLEESRVALERGSKRRERRFDHESRIVSLPLPSDRVMPVAAKIPGPAPGEAAGKIESP